MSDSVRPIDSSPPGSPAPGVLQARVLEWVAISFSSIGKLKVKVKSLSRVRLLATPWTAAYQAPSDGLFKYYLIHYSCLRNSMDRGAWQATVHGVTKESDTT